MSNYNEYFEYLQKRSFIGKAYRDVFLYKLISRNFKKEDLVLDFGCGIGDYLEYRDKTVGVDINPKLVDLCKTNGFNAYLIESEQLPFDNETFDAVLMDNVLEHLENPSNSLIEINRVLKKKGALLIGVPGIKGFNFDNDHKLFYDQYKLDTLMQQYGYRCEKRSYTPFLIKSEFLSNNCRIYALYTLYRKI